MDLEKLRRRVGWSTHIAFIIFVFVILAYVGKLWLLSGGALADDPEAWGQFGDYVGGLLNPLIAFLAFYWLTQSVLLQKQELAETKEALKDSALSQSKQVQLASRAAEINALSGLLSSHNSDLSRLREDSRFIMDQITRVAENRGWVQMPDGNLMGSKSAREKVEEIEVQIKDIFVLRNVVIDRLNDLLTASIVDGSLEEASKVG